MPDWFCYFISKFVWVQLEFTQRIVSLLFAFKINLYLKIRNIEVIYNQTCVIRFNKILDPTTLFNCNYLKRLTQISSI